MAEKVRTTVVGSYPIPAWLAETQESKQTSLDALTVVLRAQERAGLDVISDGEISRFDPAHPETNGMIDYFISRMEGISTELSRSEIEAFRRQPGMEFRKSPAGAVRSRLGEGTLFLQEDFNRVRSLTNRPFKFTVTSPYMLAKTLLDNVYHDLERLVMDIAEVLRVQVEGINSTVLQVDEANLPGNPEDSAIAAQGINHIFSSANSRHKAVHLCFGNYGGQTIQRGTWQALLSFFNALKADHLLLEFARRGYAELEFLTDLREEINLGIGVVDIKDNQVESPDIIARRIEKSASVLGRDRIRWIHPDCGFWMLPRWIADGKMRAMVKGRDSFLGM